MADQQDKRRRLGARVWLVVDGKKKRPGVLWWIGEDTVMLREDGAPGLRGFAWSDKGERWGFVGQADDDS